MGAVIDFKKMEFTITKISDKGAQFLCMPILWTCPVDRQQQDEESIDGSTAAFTLPALRKARVERSLKRMRVSSQLKSNRSPASRGNGGGSAAC